MPEIRPLPDIGARVRAVRKQKRLSLEQLAKHSGVSKSVLSAIERSETNPTFATLWNLTNALGIAFDHLTSGMSGVCDDAIEVVQPHFTPEIRSEDGDCVLRILGPADVVGVLEWYEIRIAAGGALKSRPHRVGTIEHLTVLEGVVEVVSGAVVCQVAAGGTARYAGDKPHEIRNRSQTAARGLLVVSNL